MLCAIVLMLSFSAPELNLCLLDYPGWLCVPGYMPPDRWSLHIVIMVNTFGPRPWKYDTIQVHFYRYPNRGSSMSVHDHVILNLLNEFFNFIRHEMLQSFNHMKLVNENHHAIKLYLLYNSRNMLRDHPFNLKGRGEGLWFF